MGKTMFFNLNSGTVFVTTVDGVDGFSSSFYISVVFFFFNAILVSWWLFDYWVKAKNLT